MAHARTRHHHNNAAESKPDRSSPNRPGEANEQHEHPPATDGAADDRMRRAEELADRIGERVGHYASVVGLGIMRLAARAREEAEDIWAEAQHIRQRAKSPQG